MRYCENRTKDLKTNELIGPALDRAVSYALGHNPMKDFHSHGMTWGGWWETTSYIDTKPNEYRRIPRYSIDWGYGGPIIEREKIELEWSGFEWWACMRADEDESGPTPLIAAMRCYCCAKLGEFVDIPEELCQQESN